MHFAELLLGLLPGELYEAAHPAQLARLYEDRMQRLVLQEGAASPAVARAAIDTAQFLYSVGRIADARKWLEQSLSITESAAAHEWLATVAPESALAHLERAVALRPPSVELARLHTRLAGWYESHGAPKPALDEYRAAVAVYENLPAAGAALAVALDDLGLALEPEFAEAERCYRRALALQERLLGPRHAETGITLNNLAGAVGAQGRLVQAEPLLRRALAVLDAQMGLESAKSAHCAANLGDLLTALGRRQEARTLYARALAAFEALGDAESAARVRAARQ